jgi:spore coat polysaccharide biosynthesis protein SpsF
VTVVATIEARMGSSRLPGKTLLPILGRPMLELLLERVRPAAGVDRVVVASSTEVADHAIADLCARLDVACHRGSEHDVRARILDAVREHRADILVKLTGDNPLVHHRLVESMLERFLASDCDLVTNGAMEYSRVWHEERTFPVGLNVQVLRVASLEDAAARFPDSPYKEHVTLDILAHPEIYHLEAFHAQGEFAALHRPQWRFTVDTEADLAFVRAVFQALYQEGRPFTLDEVADFLCRRPEITALNAGCKQSNPLGPS